MYLGYSSNMFEFTLRIQVHLFHLLRVYSSDMQRKLAHSIYSIRVLNEWVRKDIEYVSVCCAQVKMISFMNLSRVSFRL